MIVTAKIDVDVTIEAGSIVIRAYDPDGECCFTEKFGLYELISETVDWYRVPGTEIFKLDAEENDELEATRSELADALEYVECILENAN